MNQRWIDVCIAIVLAVLTVWVFWPVRDSGFVNFDDGLYVTENPHLAHGFSQAGLRWAFADPGMINWTPVTLMTYLGDYAAGGLDPRRYHVTNLIFHAGSVLVLYAALRRLLGGYGMSAWIAAIFAVHPMHVESVAWVAERKDVVYGFFWMVTMLAHGVYARKPGLARYGMVCLAGALCLMSKPMAITLPVALLILDYWPLRRFWGDGGIVWKKLGICVIEKAPLMVGAVAVTGVTYCWQRSGGALLGTEAFPLPVRLGTALTSVIMYLGKAVWPVQLSVFYPHPGEMPDGYLLGVAGICAVLITGAAMIGWRRFPALAAGWGWHVATLLPVLGILQAGGQAMADRYMYVPMLGLSFGVAAGASAWAERSRMARGLCWVGALGIVGACAVLSRQQIAYWQDSVSLWSHALTVTPDDPTVRYKLGESLRQAERYGEAEPYLDEVLGIQPGRRDARIPEAIEALAADDLGRAAGLLGAVLAADGLNKEARLLLGKTAGRMARMEGGDVPVDGAQLREAVGAVAERELGGQAREAVCALAVALRGEPEPELVFMRVADALHERGLLEAALQYYAGAVSAAKETGKASCLAGLGMMLAELGCYEQAAVRLGQSLALNPKQGDVAFNMGQALAGLEEWAGAVRYLRSALELMPDDASVREALLHAEEMQRRLGEAN